MMLKISLINLLPWMLLGFGYATGKRYRTAGINVGYGGIRDTSLGSLNGFCRCEFEDTKIAATTCGSTAAFMLLIQSLILARDDISEPCQRTGVNAVPDDEWYDFIIVGAGVAGPVIARRLSDSPGVKVLLVEAGPEEPTMASIPGFYSIAVNTSLDWHFLTEPTQPEPTACLETNGVCTWPRGKMVSGTGSLYGMMYIRGHPEIFNTWYRAGNTGWAYDDIEHYFERAENPARPEMVSSRPFRRTQTGGPMYIDNFNDNPAFSEVLLNAAREAGYRTTWLHDYNQTGFMVAPMMTRDGLRGTTSKFYLRPVSHRKNLHVLINAHVTKILIDESANVAYGIEYINKNGETKIARTRKEVILSAGAIGSPQILLLSGIGPKEHLTELGLKTIKDLAVGKNLHNHVSVGVTMTINDTSYETLTQEAVNEFLETRGGPWSSTGITQVTGLVESSYATPGIPDLQIFFDGYSSTCVDTGLSTECADGTLGRCTERRQIGGRPTVLIPRTRGYMELRSTDPLDPPLLYPNYFTDETDIKILLEGIKKVISLTETSALQAWDIRLDTTPHPLCTQYDFGTDDYWVCVIRAATGPENHQSGSCKMGPKSDNQAVVDPELRVHGIPNIRVADASIFPEVPNCNPSSAIIMTAEKASDLIRTTWSLN